jgi:hypothetical protein
MYGPAVIMCRCETWSVTIREEHRLKIFENRVLRRIFGLKRDGMVEVWRKLSNEELYYLLNIIRMYGIIIQLSIQQIRNKQILME